MALTWPIGWWGSGQSAPDRDRRQPTGPHVPVEGLYRIAQASGAVRQMGGYVCTPGNAEPPPGTGIWYPGDGAGVGSAWAACADSTAMASTVEAVKMASFTAEPFT
jgi:hypothetical protein